MAYTIYATPTSKLIGVATFAGKTVRATATCSEKDEYDYETGCDLVVARLDAKVADKKVKLLNQKLEDANKQIKEIEAQLRKAIHRAAMIEVRYQDACDERETAYAALQEIENKLAVE